MKYQRGTVSIVALWLLAVLSLAVVGAAVAARSELKALSWNEWSAQRHGAASYALAQAQQLLLTDAPGVDGLADRWALLDDDGWQMASAPEGWVNRMRISDEERKLNINLCDGRAFERLGDLTAEQVYRLLEARSAIGLRLKVAGKTIGFLSVDDIPRVLFGKSRFEERERESPPILADPAWMLTVRGKGKINVNTASPDVFRSALGIHDSVILGIVGARSGRDGVDGSSDDTPIESVKDLREVNGVTVSDYDILSKSAVVASSLFHIEIRTARAGREGLKGHLAVTVERKDGELRILEWQEW